MARETSKGSGYARLCKYRAVQTKLYNDFCDINNPQFDFSIVFFGFKITGIIIIMSMTRIFSKA